MQFVSNAPEYYCTTLDEVKLDLIQKATENAKQRIDIMAAGTGCRPGKLLSAKPWRIPDHGEELRRGRIHL